MTLFCGAKRRNPQKSLPPPPPRPGDPIRGRMTRVPVAFEFSLESFRDLPTQQKWTLHFFFRVL